MAYADNAASAQPAGAVYSAAALRSYDRSTVLTPTVSAGGGSTPAAVMFMMTGRSSSGWVYWTVAGSPDLAGSSAPGAVAPGSVAVLRSWVQ